MAEKPEKPEYPQDPGMQEPADPEYEYDYGSDAVQNGYYGTGSTTPPKDHAGLVALVLILIVSFASIISGLRLMNIDIFDRPEQPGPDPDAPTVLSADPREESPAPADEQISCLEGEELHRKPDGGSAADTSGTPDWNTRLEIQESPTGVPNTAAVEGAISWQEVYRKVIPSVVSIVCRSPEGAVSSGTGVIMNTDGFLLTNAHVVEGAAAIQVMLSDNREFSAAAMGADRISDLAVLRIEADALQPAEFGDSSVLQVGDPVVAIGDPLGVELRGTMTDGIISAINRNILSHGRPMTLIQTTAALNAGNSGGPLVNCYGQVVGINTMKIGDYASDGGVEGLGFAIPVTTVQMVIEELMTQGYVSGRPDLGIEGHMLSGVLQHFYQLPPGLLVDRVDADSDAAAQGIRPGDILLRLNQTPIRSIETMEQILNSLEVGDQVEASFYRNECEIRIRLTVGEAKG